MARSLNDIINGTPLKNQSPSIKTKISLNQMSSPISNDKKMIFSQKAISNEDQTILTQSHKTMIVMPSDHSHQWNIHPENFRIVPENLNPRVILPTPPNKDAIKQGCQNQRVDGNANELCIPNHWVFSTAQQNVLIQPGHKNQQMTVPAYPSGSIIPSIYDNRRVPVRNNEREIHREPENKRATVSAQINGRDNLLHDNHRLTVPAHSNGIEVETNDRNQKVILSANPNGREIQPENTFSGNRWMIVTTHPNEREIHPDPANHRIILTTHPNGTKNHRPTGAEYTSGIENQRGQGTQSAIVATPPNRRDNQLGQQNHLRNHNERPIQSGHQNNKATLQSVLQPGHSNIRMAAPANDNEKFIQSAFQYDRNTERAPQLTTQSNVPAPPNERANNLGHPNLSAVPPAIQSISEAVSRELIAIHHHLDVMEVKLPYYEEIALYLGYQKERLKLSQFYGQVEKQRRKESNGTANNPCSTSNQMQPVVHGQRETQSACHYNIQNGKPMSSQHQNMAPSSSSQIKPESQFVYEKARAPQPVSRITLPLPPQQSSYSLPKHSEPHSSQIQQNTRTNFPPQNVVRQNYSSIPQQQNMDNQKQDELIYRLIEMDVPSTRGVPAQRTRGRKVYPRGTRGGRGRPSGSTNSVSLPDFQQLSESLNRLTYFHKYLQSNLNPSANQMPNPKPQLYSSSPLNDPTPSSEPNEPLLNDLNPLNTLSLDLQNLNAPKTLVKNELVENYTQIPYRFFSNPQHSPISINSSSPEPQDLTISEPQAPEFNLLPPMEPTQGELDYSHEVPQQTPIALVVHNRSDFDLNSIQFQNVAELFGDTTLDDINTVLDQM